MRRLFLYGSVGLFSLGCLSGCSLFRGSDTDACKSRVGVAQERSTTCQVCPPRQIVQTAPPPLAPKSEIKTAAPVAISVEPVPAEVRTVTPAPVPVPVVAPMPVPAPMPAPVPAPMPMPAPMPVPPPTPRLPAAHELPVLPPPPWKNSANDGPTPLDKIIVVSNLEPSSAKPEMRDLIDVTEPRKAAVPAAPTINDRQIAFGRDESFTTITGQVQEFRKTLRLRYAAVDRADIYGGVVTLEGDVDLSQLRDGKQVRVRGVLIPPAEPNENARYRVTAVEYLD